MRWSPHSPKGAEGRLCPAGRHTPCWVILQKLPWHRTLQAHVHTLSQLLRSIFCLQRSQREARAAAGAAQYKGEAALNPTTTLNSQSGRDSTDLNTVSNHCTHLQGRRERDSNIQASEAAASGPQTLQPISRQMLRAETPLRSFPPPPTALRLRLALLPILTLSPHPPCTA